MQADPEQAAADDRHRPTGSPPEAERPRHLLIAAMSPAAVNATLELTLPSLLGSGNLGRLERNGRAIAATILCLSADRARLEAAPTFRAFAAGRSISWHWIEDLVGLLGDASEAIVSEAFRAAMARRSDQGRGCSFLLIKAGYVFADGALTTVVQRLDRGAAAVVVPVPMISAPALAKQVETGESGLTARALASTALADASAVASRLHELGGLFGLVPEPREASAAPSVRRLWTARPYPVGLRPERPVDPARESLIDAEVVPEFAADEGAVYRPASSDEILILEGRPEHVLKQDVASSGQSRAVQLTAWVTPWHLRNLCTPYDLVVDDDGRPPSGLEPPVIPTGPGIPAVRHPAWLVARGLAAVPTVLGRERRYMSLLDSRYKTARKLIEAIEAEAAIYAGHAGSLFAPLLCRRFRDALIGSVPKVVRAAKHRQGGREKVLYIFHVDLNILSVLMTGLMDAVAALVRCQCPALIIVEADDRSGGMHGAERHDLLAWHQAVVQAIEAAGGTSRMGSTTLEFFDGHPGFWITSTPPSTKPRNSQDPAEMRASDTSPAQPELVSRP